MGGGSTRDIIAGNVGGFTAHGVSRKLRGETTIGRDIRKQFNPSSPSPPDVPEFPEIDAEKDRLLKEALISRLRADFQRGTGRQATIATSAAGVTNRSKVFKRKLAGVA